MAGSKQTEKFHMGEAKKHEVSEKNHLEAASIKAKEKNENEINYIAHSFSACSKGHSISESFALKIPASSQGIGEK